VLVAGCLWGLSGTAAQVLFQRHGVSPQWLVTMRMAGAGLILLPILRPRPPALHQWPSLTLFAIFGVAAVQYTYFAAIALSNVATATFIQYTSVPMIAAWEVFRGRSRLTAARASALAAALAGVGMLALGGPDGMAQLRVTPLGLVFGLLSAATAAFYTLSSVRLVRTIGPWATTSWGFLAGAVPMVLWAPPWAAHPRGSLFAVAALTGFVVVFGTLIAFGLYLASFRMISPTQAAITATAEPLAAAVAALVFLRVALLPLQYVGGAAILAAVVLLRREAARPDPLPEPPP